MSFDACAALVERGDPDRFMAAMAAPVEARRVLFPLYAFNVEVSRAPWVTEEPMIAEMRLQWWRDALEEIAKGGPVRRHEVTTPLTEVLDAKAASALDQVVAVRRWDIYKDPFEDAQHFVDYFRKGGAELMWQAARLLGAPDDMRLPVLNYGAAVSVSRYLAAVSALEESGRVPLINGTREGLVTLALNSAADAGSARSLRKRLPKLAHAALLEGWTAKPVLMQIASEPQRVADGTVGISQFRSKIRLLRWS
jgi:phytoene synthase